MEKTAPLETSGITAQQRLYQFISMFIFKHRALCLNRIHISFTGSSLVLILIISSPFKPLKTSLVICVKTTLTSCLKTVGECISYQTWSTKNTHVMFLSMW